MVEYKDSLDNWGEEVPFGGKIYSVKDFVEGCMGHKINFRSGIAYPIKEDLVAVDNPLSSPNDICFPKDMDSVLWLRRGIDF